MSARSPRWHRVVLLEQRTFETFVEASSSRSAEKLAARAWRDLGDKSFKLKETSFDVALVEAQPL